MISSILTSSLELGPLGFRGITTSSAAASLAAVEKIMRQMKGRPAMPWDNPVSEQEAASTLGSFLGISGIQPGDVLNLQPTQMEALLSSTTIGGGNPALENALYCHAESVTRRFFNNEVYYRGIVEFSNVCENDCGYCGIRKHQPRTSRYTIPIDEVVNVAEWAMRHQVGTLMLQSGQLNTPQRNAYIVDMVQRVKQRTKEVDLELRQAAAGDDAEASPPIGAARGGNENNNNNNNDKNLGLCVALSVGELPLEQYRAFKQAGADRFLLRIETSNPDLYAALHPSYQTWDSRVQALYDLKDAGFQIGTGVMVGLPGQTLGDLASDIAFFKTIGADMIGLGPYITEPGTPVSEMWNVQYGNLDKTAHMASMVQLTTRVNALARITLGNVNIAATTALQALDPMGRELALRRGANILMPILTPTRFREHYTLYEGKPCINDTAEECQKCLGARLAMIEKKLKPGVWGNPPSFTNRLTLNGNGGLYPSVGTINSNAMNNTTERRGLHYAALCQQQDVETSCDECRTPSSSSSTKCHIPTKEGFSAAARANGPAPTWVVPSHTATIRGSDVPRTNIGIFGRMNAGKSSLMNRLARAEVSIVDSTPGTTADNKVSLMELHAAGPVKIFDTAGVDEDGELGGKKRRKAMATVKECDVAAVVVSLRQLADRMAVGSNRNSSDDVFSVSLREALHWELELLEKSRRAGALPVLVFNRAAGDNSSSSSASATAPTGGNSQNQSESLRDDAARLLDPDGVIPTLDVSLSDIRSSSSISSFLENVASQAGAAHHVPCLPEKYLTDSAVVFLNIPMDAETPSMRLLRPQALVQEEAIRRFATTIAYRMNLGAARSTDRMEREAERQRFQRALDVALASGGPTIVVTDSQAVDIVHPWTLDPNTGDPMVPFTTFSIAMIQRQSRGSLPTFARGIEAVRGLRAGDRVLVAEACNHNRITELCNDIGTVQIPKKLQEIAVRNYKDSSDGSGNSTTSCSSHEEGREASSGSGRGIIIEHAFGREFPEIDELYDGPSEGFSSSGPATSTGIEKKGLKRFALAVHCGGCMVDSQKIRARVSDLEEAGVPVTNYGLLLAYGHSPEAMRRALEPWGVAAGRAS